MEFEPYERRHGDQVEDLVYCEGCRASRDSGKALLVVFPDGQQDWIPHSQIDSESEVYEETDQPGRLVIKKWLAEKRGWI